jgi:hypothetical protein
VTLRQAAIAGLGKAPQALDRQKRMLDLRAHTGLASVGFPVGIGQRSVPVSALIGEVLGLSGYYRSHMPNFNPKVEPSLSKYAMYENSWDGVLEFSDKKSMNRLRKYVGAQF